MLTKLHSSEFSFAAAVRAHQPSFESDTADLLTERRASRLTALCNLFLPVYHSLSRYACNPHATEATAVAQSW